jgi:hypothetical protein
MSARGPSRHFAAAQQFRRFRREADIGAGFMSPRPKLNSSSPRSWRTPSNPSRDFEYEPFDQPSDNDYSKHFCEKNWHALETRIERFPQSCICLVLALLIFRLICCFPFCSIFLRSQTLQCVILSSQSIITHAELRAIKPVSLSCLKNPRVYPETHKGEHRQNDADPLPTIEPDSHLCARYMH